METSLYYFSFCLCEIIGTEGLIFTKRFPQRVQFKAKKLIIEREYTFQGATISANI